MPFDPPAPPAWRVLDAPAFCALELPPRRPVLGALLAGGTIALVRGPKGVGKSHLALEIALAVAKGGKALAWTAPTPRRVLYVDADLPLALLQERLKSLSHGAPPATLALLAAEAQDEFPSLGLPAGIQALERCLDGVDLLVLDGLSSLMALGPSTRWHALTLALRAWRKRGLAVLLVDRSGLKGGALALEGLLDLTLALARPVDHDPREGLRCDVLIESRTGLGPEVAPLEADLEAGAWRVLAKGDAEVTSALRLSAAGYTVRDIARALKTSKSRAHRLVAQAQSAADALRQRTTVGTAGTSGTNGTGETPGTMPRPDPDQAAIEDLIRAIQIRGQPDVLPPHHPAARLAVFSEDTLRTALEVKLGSRLSNGSMAAPS